MQKLFLEIVFTKRLQKSGQRFVDALLHSGMKTTKT